MLINHMNKQESLKVVRLFLKNTIEKEEWYQEIKPYLKAIILYGSVAKGTNRADSDIDILFILPIEVEKKYTQGEYFYHFENKEINIVIRSIEKLRKIAGEKFNSFEAEVFRDSKIIWQKDNEVKQLIDQIRKGDSTSNFCSQCGVCCKLFFINLNKTEYQSGKYETILGSDPKLLNFTQASKCGANFLAKKANGSCIYLKNNSCDIHTTRPKVCRAFFCGSKDKRFESMRQLVAKNKKI